RTSAGWRWGRASSSACCPRVRLPTRRCSVLRLSPIHTCWKGGLRWDSAVAALPPAVGAAHTPAMEIEAVEARRMLPELTDLLVDAVDGGAGNAFLRPLAPSVASAYWEGRIGDIESGRSILLGSLAADGALLGIVVVDLAGQQNGQHRAEVTKLMVPSSARRQGLGARLINEAEEAARARGRWL